MLLTVGRGLLFASSSSGYGKGLSLLILGCRNKEKPMTVSPWKQCQLVKLDVNLEFQLAPTKGKISRRCASFICFGCVSSGTNGKTPPKVGPVHHSETSLVSSTTDSGKVSVTDNAVDKGERRMSLKSSLKKPLTDSSVLAIQAVDSDDSSKEIPSSTAGFTKRRKIQWTDTCGKELVQVREFQPSDDSLSDVEFEHEGDKCQCVIQ